MKKLFLIPLFLITIAHAQSWTPHSSGSTAVVLRLSFPTADTGYLVNDVGEVRKTVNGALNWTLTASPGSPYFNDVHFFNGSTGLVCGDSLIYRTTNGGASWTLVFTGSHQFFNYFNFISPTVGFVSSSNPTGDSLYFYKTTNAGVTWSLVSAKIAWAPYYTPIFFQNTSNGFYAEEEVIGKSTDGGINFDTVYNGSVGDMLQSLTFANVDTGYASYLIGTTLRTTDGGLNWSVVGNAGSGVYDLHFINGRNGFACGGNGVNTGWVMRTSDAGVTWTIDYQSTYSYNCFSFPSDSVGYAGGQGGYVIKHTGPAMGIVNEGMNFNCSVFPNPAHDFVNLQNIPINANVSLIDATSKQIFTLTADQANVTIDTHAYPAGIYFVEINDEKSVTRKKIAIL